MITLRRHLSTCRSSDILLISRLLASALFVAAMACPVFATGNIPQEGDDPDNSPDWFSLLSAAPGTEPRPLSERFNDAEQVSLLSGNLHISQPLSPSYHLDGGGAISLVATYNSKSVYLGRASIEDADGFPVRNFFHGDSWVGAGWQLHLGRLFHEPRFSPNHANSYAHGDKLLFEDSAVNQHQLEPFQLTLQPHFEYTLAEESFCPPDKIYCEPTHECCDGTRQPPFDENDICYSCDCDCAPEDVYDVTRSDGTIYRLQRRVSDVRAAYSGYLRNRHRSGFYPRRMTNSSGQVAEIDYWEEWDENNGGSRFPEAIKEIRVRGAAVIRTELWDSDLHSSLPEYHAELQGRLKAVLALRNGAWVRHELQYEIVDVIDYTGPTGLDPVPLGPVQSRPAALLSEIRLPSTGGQSESIRFEYTENGTYSLYVVPRIHRITYPSGAVSEYQYGRFQMGERPWGLCPYLGEYQYFPNCDQACQESHCDDWVKRWGFGVVERTLHPDGVTTDPQNPTPNYKWQWKREVSGDPLDPNDTDVSSFTLLSPDGSWTDSSFWGRNDGQCEEPGVGEGEGDCFNDRVKQKTYYSGAGVPTRVESFDYTADDYQEMTLENAWYPVGVALRSSSTTYLDDASTDESCFETEPAATSGTKKIEAVNYNRSEWGSFDLREVKGDYTPAPRYEYNRHYDSNSVPQCLADNNIRGLLDFSFRQEGATRSESSLQFACDGKITSQQRLVALQQANAPSGDLNSWTPDAPKSGETLGVDSTFTNGNETLRSYSRSSLSKTYDLTYGWSNGRAVSARFSGLTYYSQEVATDAEGLTVSATGPNGLVTTFQYDDLGRLAQKSPPSPEFATRLVYPSINEAAVIQSAGTEVVFDPADDNQIYRHETFDGLGRVRKIAQAMPDGELAVRVLRYDELGRVVFASEWIPEQEFNTLTWDTWTSTADRDGDGTVDSSHFVTVPLVDGLGTLPWGAVTFYGEPDPTDPDNPLAAISDSLGRVREVRQVDGSKVSRRYCGPHEELRTYDVRSGTDGATRDITNRFYYNGFGQLVIVDSDVRTGNQPGDGADAVYAYDVNGNLIKANLIDQIPNGEPIALWKNDVIGGANDEISDGQVRTFRYNAVGEIEESSHPEKGTEEFLSYDAAGNVLERRDQKGIDHGYRFVNTYDVAGRLTSTDLSWDDTGDADIVLSEPFDAVGNWEEDDPDSTSNWQIVSYSNLGCIEPPPGESGGSGYYFGEDCTKGYQNAPSDPQTTKLEISNVDPEDAITFKYWRQVRQNATAGAGDRDRFFVAVSLTATGPKRIVLDLDEGQASLSTWRQAPRVRLRDLFTTNEWDTGSRSVWVHLVFHRNDNGDNTGIVAGVMIDNLRVGRDASERLVEQTYDENHCSGSVAGAACQSGANYPLGNLTTVKSYQDGRWIGTRRWVFQGMNGRASGTNQRTDWTGLGWETPNSEQGASGFVWRTGYDNLGLPTTVVAPYVDGQHWSRDYQYEFSRGSLVSFHEQASNGAEIPFFGSSHGLQYSAAGAPTLIDFVGSQRVVARDDRHRSLSIHAIGHDGATLWDSGAYSYDGGGNVAEIGEQSYAYDGVGRLAAARSTRQAGESTLLPSARQSHNIDYSYDSYGNMTARCPNYPSADLPAAMTFGCQGTGYPLPLPHTRNQIQLSEFTYDVNGNLTRFPGGVNQQVGATWDERNRMRLYYGSDPVGGGSLDGGSPVEQYLYDATGFRLVKIDKTGIPILSLREGAGRAVSEFKGESLGSGLVFELSKDFLYGAGQLLVEREVGDPAPSLTTHSVFSTGTSYSLQVSDGVGYDSYTVDIWTESGFRNVLQGVQPDASGVFDIDESDMSPDETNYVRIKGVGTDRDSLYSHPTTIYFDPSTLATDPNPIRATGVSRDGTDIVVRWKLLEPTAVSKLYFKDPQTGQTVAVTPLGLPMGADSLTIGSQSLSSVCGAFELVTLIVGGESEPLGPVDNTRESDCGGGGSPPQDPPETGGYQFTSSFHHRDHLGTLRVAVDETGFPSVARATDFYPFGMQMGSVDSSESSHKYAGHERDTDTGLDYMKARYCGSQFGRFMSPDKYPADLQWPVSFNAYRYAGSNPMNLVDPTGLYENHAEAHAALVRAGYGFAGNWSQLSDAITSGVMITENRNVLANTQYRFSTTSSFMSSGKFRVDFYDDKQGDHLLNLAIVTTAAAIVLDDDSVSRDAALDSGVIAAASNIDALVSQAGEAPSGIILGVNVLSMQNPEAALQALAVLAASDSYEVTIDDEGDLAITNKNGHTDYGFKILRRDYARVGLEGCEDPIECIRTAYSD